MTFWQRTNVGIFRPFVRCTYFVVTRHIASVKPFKAHKVIGAKWTWFWCNSYFILFGVFCILLLVINVYVNYLGWRRESFFVCYRLLVITCMWFLFFLLALGMGCVILLWHSPCLPYKYFVWQTQTKLSFRYFSSLNVSNLNITAIKTY